MQSPVSIIYRDLLIDLINRVVIGFNSDNNNFNNTEMWPVSLVRGCVQDDLNYCVRT